MTSYQDDTDLESLKRSFILGLSDRILSIEEMLLNLEKSDSKEFIRESIRSLMLEVHSLKGSSSALHIHPIAVICHNLEDLLVPISNAPELSSPQKISLLFSVVDLITQYSDEYLSSQMPPNPQKYNKLVENLVEVETMQKNNNKLITEIDSNPNSVLILPASRTITRQLKKYYEAKGIKVTVVNNAIEALDKISNFDYSYFITSYQIDPFDGFKLISMINTLKKEKPPITVLLTADSQHHDNFALCPPDFIIFKDVDMLEQLDRITLESKYVIKGNRDLNSFRTLERIFILDDDRDMLNLYQLSYKKNKGQLVRFSANSMSALSEIKDFRPHLVVSDLNMPLKNGVALMHEKSLEAAIKDIPVIFITGDINSNLSQQAINEGALAVVDKTLVDQNFSIWLNNFVNIKKAFPPSLNKTAA